MVGIVDVAVHVARDDADDPGLGQPAELALALDEGLLGTLALGDLVREGRVVLRQLDGALEDAALECLVGAAQFVVRLRELLRSGDGERPGHQLDQQGRGRQRGERGDRLDDAR